MTKTTIKSAALLLPLSLSLILGTAGCVSTGSSQPQTQAAALCFNESILPVPGGFLASNFGSASQTPQDDEYKGYILRYQDGSLQPFIDGKGRLNRPSAMAIYKDQLFVTEKNELVIYDLVHKGKAPQSIKFYAS